MSFRYRVGIDENGLGPLLGPLLVTAVMARTTERGAAYLRRRPRGSLGERLGDSKRLVAHGDVALGEAWARALVRRGGGARAQAEEPGSPAEVVAALSHASSAELLAPCPPRVAPQCWSPSGEGFAADEGLVAAVEADLARLADKGVEVVAARSAIVCAKRLNDGANAGLSRFVQNLHAMEALALAMRSRAGEDVSVTCGKVGGYKAYGRAFGPLAGRLHAVVEESPQRSAYRFPGVGELAFERDCDAHDLLVGMASLVGKYLRELLMARIVRHHRALASDALAAGAAPDELPDASGYHDPVTARFVEATALARARHAVPDACFFRLSTADAASVPRRRGDR